MYCASKYALEAMTEALRMEVAPYGLRVSLIEPGDMKTGNSDNRLQAEATATSVYRERFRKAVREMEKGERNGPEPVSVANTVLWLVKRRHPPVRIVTTGIQYKLFRLLKRIVPDRLAIRIIARMYGS
jgi:NAD(P)-dependent dehydrogenase (short-subunit alcohol dehydrogenase family)